MKKRIFIGFENPSKAFGIFRVNKDESIFENDFMSYVFQIQSLEIENDIPLIINTEFFSNELNPNDFWGINLLEYLRIKLRWLNPIILMGFTNLESLISLKPESLILFGKGVNYIQLPVDPDKLENKIINLKPLENEEQLVMDYQDLIRKTFNISGLEHGFANEYGIKLMTDAYTQVTGEKFEIPINYHLNKALLFAKADFLFNINTADETKYFKTQIKDDDKGALPTFRYLMANKVNKILHIDDEGETQKWYEFIRTLGNLNKTNYCSISQSELIYNGKINTSKILKKIQDFKPNLILIDLRLLGKEEEVDFFDEYSGAELIEEIRKLNPWVPIMLVSATNKLKSLESLQEHPYNILSLWSKPRVESGNFNIYEILLDLLVKINSALTLYSSEVAKHNVVSDYFLREYKVSKKKIENFPNCTHYFVDTNCLNSEKETSTRLHLALHRLIMEDYNVGKEKPKIIILRDVITELQKLAYLKKLDNSEDDLERKSAASYGLDRLIDALNNYKGNITDYYEDSQYIINEKIDYEINTQNEIEMKFSKVVRYNISKDEAEKELKIFKNYNAKTTIHADDIFRLVMVKKLNNPRFKGKIGLITNDRGLQDLILGDFKKLGFRLIDNNPESSKERYIKIFKDENLKGEVFGESVFVNALLKDEYEVTW